MALLIEYKGKRPQVAGDVFLAPTAVLIGDVRVESGASIWFGAVLRGDFEPIRVGEESLIEDNAVLHGRVVVGRRCVIGHGAVLHGCTVGDGAVVGANAVVFDGTETDARSVTRQRARRRAPQQFPTQDSSLTPHPPPPRSV